MYLQAGEKYTVKELLTGLLLAGDRGGAAPWIPATTGISALVAVVISAVMGDGLKGKISAQPIRCAPRAALQSALYPLAAAALIWWIHPGKFIPGFFAGLALFALCRTPFRRSPSEARPLNLALLAVAGIAAAAWAVTVQIIKLYVLSDAVPMACAMLLAAALCAFALFGNIRRIE